MDHDRRSPRLDLSFPVLVESGGEVKRLLATNVSEQGMLFLAAEPYLLGSRLRVTFTLPWTDVELGILSEVVHVAWCQDDRRGHFRIGLHFAEVEDDDQHRPLRALPC